MTRRLQTAWWVGALMLCASMMMAVPARAQAGSTERAQVSAASIARARTAVNKATTDRHIVMTDAAKRELALEVAREEAATPKGTAATEPTPEAKVDRLFTRIDFASPGTAVDADRVRKSVALDRSSQVRSTLEEEVKTQASVAGLTLPPDVQELIVRDLQKQTDGLAASGLPVDKIKAKNEIYFKAIAGRLQGVPVTTTSYTQMREEIFQQFVHLRIESVPAGATVRMNDVELGLTDIPNQPLEPGKTYQFDFTLAGYRPAHRPYYVNAGERTLTLTEPLAPDKSGPGGEGDSAEPEGTQSPSLSFPYLWVIAAVVLLSGLVWLAQRR